MLLPGLDTGLDCGEKGLADARAVVAFLAFSSSALRRATSVDFSTSALCSSFLEIRFGGGLALKAILIARCSLGMPDVTSDSEPSLSLSMVERDTAAAACTNSLGGSP